MGFGLLVIGYFLTSVMTVYTPFTAAMLIGYPLMALAFYRLAPYWRRFLLPLALCCVGIPFGVYLTLFSFAKIGLVGALPIFGEGVFAVVEWLYFVYLLALHLTVLWSLAAYMQELGLLSLQSTALRNLTFVAIYHFIYLVANLPLAFFREHGTAFALPIVLMRYLCVFLNLWLFFRCYRNILPEGSDIAPEPPRKKEKKDDKKS